MARPARRAKHNPGTPAWVRRYYKPGELDELAELAERAQAGELQGIRGRDLLEGIPEKKLPPRLRRRG